MLDKAKDIITAVAGHTDSVILMHSLNGKDSIAMLELCYPHFKRVVCCFMFIVPNLEHLNPYIAFARHKYPKAEWVQAPHYVLTEYVKTGYMGCKQNTKQRKCRLADIVEKVREQTGIEWVGLGFKQSDSLNRLLMLRQYDRQGICESGKKFYPLSEYNNGDINAYIRHSKLIKPETYGNKGRSVGTDITNYNYLKWLEKHHPADLARVFDMFPMTRGILAGL